MDLTSMLNAKMALFQSQGVQGVKYGTTIHGTDIVDLCERGIESLTEYMNRYKEHLEEYKDEEGTPYQIRIDLLKIDKEHYKKINQ